MDKAFPRNPHWCLSFGIPSCSLLSHDLEISFPVSGKEWREIHPVLRRPVYGRILTFETEKAKVGLFCSLVDFSVKWVDICQPMSSLPGGKVLKNRKGDRKIIQPIH